MSIGRTLTWPFRRLFDPRFQGLAQQADAVHHDLATRNDELIRRADHAREAQQAEHAHTITTLAELRELMTVDMDAATEAATVIGATLSELAGYVDDVRRQIGDPGLLTGGQVSDLSRTAAQFLNYAASHRGFAAQKRLWFNPPVVLEHVEGDVRVGTLNERIVEVPYVLRALNAVPVGSRVLDVGANESTLAVSLAAFGYRVTALDLTPYPLEHPLLEAVATPVEEWETDECYDAIVCLSTVEHIGIGAYGESPEGAEADIAAIRRMRDLVSPEGILLLTTPYGSRAETSATERIYDRAALDRLLEGWSVDDLTVAVQESELVWRRSEEGEAPEGTRAVALLTARPAN